MTHARPFTATPRPPRDAAHQWREWLVCARGRAGAAMSGATYRRDQHEVAFAGMALRGAKVPFPIPDAPAQGAARAFVELARTFAATTGTTRREQLAAAMDELAVALDAMLDEPAIRAAENARKMQGEAD